MFDADEVRLLVRAAIEQERHGTLPVDTEMELNNVGCCAACAKELIDTARKEAL